MISSLPSGRFLLRIDPELHAALRQAAGDAGVSLNEYCARKLAAVPGAPTGHGLARAVERAFDLFGGDLVGVVAFGSWTRREVADGSDVDLLLVLEESVALVRNLYLRWDASPLTLEGACIEPHFVHAPDGDDDIGGLWAEVALDGIVLFDPDLRVSLPLVGIRRQIVEGRLVRRAAHGQGYWVRNEPG